MQRTASIFVVISMHISKHRHLLYDVQTQLVLHTFHKDPNKRSIQAYFFLKYDKYLPKLLSWIEFKLKGDRQVFLSETQTIANYWLDLNSNYGVSLKKCESHPWVWTQLNSTRGQMITTHYSYNLHVKVYYQLNVYLEIEITL